jgi:hypothetical protein
MISKLECKFEDYKERELLLCSSAVDYIIYELAKNLSIGIDHWCINKYSRETFHHSGYRHSLYDMFQNEARKKIIEDLLNSEGIFVTYTEKVKLFRYITIYDDGGIIFTVSNNIIDKIKTENKNRLDEKTEYHYNNMKCVYRHAVDHIIDMLARNLSIGLDEWETTSDINHMFDCAGECYCLYKRFTNDNERKIMEDLLYKEGIKVEYSERIEKCGWLTFKNVDVITFSRI